jgi:hypothetical protein
MSNENQKKNVTEKFVEKRAKDAPPPPIQSLVGVLPPQESPVNSIPISEIPPNGGKTD